MERPSSRAGPQCAMTYSLVGMSAKYARQLLVRDLSWTRFVFGLGVDNFILCQSRKQALPVCRYHYGNTARSTSRSLISPRLNSECVHSAGKAPSGSANLSFRSTVPASAYLKVWVLFALNFLSQSCVPSTCKSTSVSPQNPLSNFLNSPHHAFLPLSRRAPPCTVGSNPVKARRSQS